MSHSIERLPKWAQQIITRLERQVDALSRDLELATNQYRYANGISVDPFRCGGPLMKLPADMTLKFRLPDGEYALLRRNKEGLNVHTSRTCIIIPRASNHFDLRTI